MIKVSVIVPVYNTSQFLARCLDSLVNQTLKEIEIIAVNDASTDNSLEILNEYSKQYKKLKIIDLKQKKNVGGARNKGIEAASGEYIGLVDSDDWVDLNMYEQLYNKAKEKDCDIVDSDYYEKRNEIDPGIYHVSNFISQLGIMNDKKRANCILSNGRMVTKIYKKKLWVNNNIKYNDSVYATSDNELSALLLVLSENTCKVNLPLYNYYFYQQSVSKKNNDYRFFDRFKTSLAFVEQYKIRGLYEKYKEEIDFRFTELFLINTIYGCISRFNPPELKMIKKAFNDIKIFLPDYKKNKYFKNLSIKIKVYLFLAEYLPKLLVLLSRFKMMLVNRKNYSN